MTESFRDGAHDVDSSNYLIGRIHTNYLIVMDSRVLHWTFVASISAHLVLINQDYIKRYYFVSTKVYLNCGRYKTRNVTLHIVNCVADV